MRPWHILFNAAALTSLRGEKLTRMAQATLSCPFGQFTLCRQFFQISIYSAIEMAELCETFI